MGHSIVNAEAFTAVLSLALILLRIRPIEQQSSTRFRSIALAPTLIFLLTAVAFLPVLHLPLLHDSYGHVFIAARESLSDLTRLFTQHPTSGDFFFRPIGYVSFWFDSKWANFDPLRWHLWNLAVHIVCCELVFLIARQLSFSQFGAMTSALFFAIHGSRIEVVAWVAARFDLLACLFVLLTLVAVNRYLDTRRKPFLGCIAVFATLALLSKESAYCLPLVAACMVCMRKRRSQYLTVLVLLSANCLAVFAYRWWVIGGIGGYGAAAGKPAILQFSLLRSLEALFFRQWGLLFFPINWSERPGIALWFTAALMLGMLIFLLAQEQGKRSMLAACLALTFAAALPVQHLLLIGADLNGARVLYLPVFGLALFWGALFHGQQSFRAQCSVAVALLAFQAAALTHNLLIWRSAALLSQEACTYVAREIGRDQTRVAVLDLPATWHGVYFLANSFPACVMLNSRVVLSELPDIGTQSQTTGRIYKWNEVEDRVKRIR